MNQNERQRHNDQNTRETEAPSEGPPAGNLNALREQAAALHAAADAAIKNVLSTNSKAFNAAMRQEGGQ